MGKCKVRTKGKGKRWVKGHSCVSNPQNKKHRDVAKTRFFQENLGQTAGTSSLTHDAVRKHEIFLGSKQKPIDDGDEEEETASVGGDTFKTFASDWTNCSNVSFNRLLNGFQPTNAHHKEMLGILAAVTEVIKKQGGTESATEYFGAMVTALTINKSEETTAAMVSLMAMVIKQVSPNVLRSTGEYVSGILLQELEEHAKTGNTVILKGTIGCLTVLIKAQELSAWNTCEWIKLSFDSILPFIISSKPKIRKLAQHAIASILKNKPVDVIHPAAEFLGDCCVSMLNQPTNDITTTVLHVLGFLKGVMFSFPKTQMKMCCEKILSIISLGEPTVLRCGLQALHGMMVMHPPVGALPTKLNARLINALYDFRPGVSDIDTILVWLSLMQEAFNNLSKLNSELCLANVPRFTKCMAEMFLNDNCELLSGAAHALKAVVIDSLGEKVEISVEVSDILHLVLDTLQACLKFQYFHAWKYIANVLGAVYKAAGGQYPNLMNPTLQVISSLRDTDKLALASSVDKAIGCAVMSMGPTAVLQIIPLQLESRLIALENGDDKPFDFPRSWIISVVKDNIIQSELEYFTQHIIPLANFCKRLRDKYLTEGSVGLPHSLELIYCQLWSLLPSFCYRPTDLKQNFKNIAKILGMALRDNKELRYAVMAGLRRLVSYGIDFQDKDAKDEMARYAKNYLPILLNIYTTVSENNSVEEHGHRLAALETIKLYLKIASEDMCCNLFDLAFDKLTTSIALNTGGKKKHETKISAAAIASRHALLQLISALLSHVGRDRLDKLFALIPQLLTTTDHRTQKRGYRVIVEMFSSPNKDCLAFVAENASIILKLLIDTQDAAKPPSRAHRLHCLMVLLYYLQPCHKEQLQLLLPEAIVCCKDINSKCRNTAFTVLLMIGKTLQRWSGKEASDVVRDYLALILPGLQGSVTLISATVLALASLINEYGKLMPEDVIELLMYNICTLLASNVREVAGACLSFLKAFLSVFKGNACEPYLPRLVQSLVDMSDDCKQHFRLKCRDLLVRLVRRYSIKVITSLVPEKDEIMHKRLKNIRKELSRKARNRELDRQQHNNSDDETMDIDFEMRPQSKSIEEILAQSDDDDDDSDFEDVSDSKTSRKPAFKQPKAWIQESENAMVDFTDPSAGKKITATDPKKVAKPGPSKKLEEKNRGFKTTPDGRLIITEAKNDDEEEERHNKGKRKRDMPDDSDEDMDAEDADDFNDSQGGQFVLAPGSKRRRAISTSSIEALTEPTMKYQAGGSGIHRPVHSQKSAHDGEDYQAKKAKGDVKKKGKLEPYAYIPMDSKLLNRRKRAKHTGKLRQLEVSAKKGALKGSKARAKVLGRRRK